MSGRPILGSHAVMVSAWVGGLRLGLLASFLSAGAANYLITQPYFEFSLGSRDVVALAIFVIETSAITMYSERWKDTEGALRNAVRREKDLVDRVLQDLEVAVALIRGEDLGFVLINAAYPAISPGKTMLGKTVSEVPTLLFDMSDII